MKITSRHHYPDFADMTPSESTSFGVLLTRLDTAMRAVTDTERDHLVTTRDQIAHFHAWLYPPPVESLLS